MKKSTINPEIVNFRSQKKDIIGKVRSIGDIGDIKNWKLAFPEINFPSVIDNTDIYWKEYSPTEIAAFVAIMQDTQLARISYSLELAFNDDEDDNDGFVDADLGGKHEFYLLLNTWFAHLFQYFEESKFDAPDNAIELLLQYATEVRVNGKVYRSSDQEGPAYLDSLDFEHKKVIQN